MHWDIPSLHSENWNPPKKMFRSENVIFRGLRLSLGHFGQQAPESYVSQLQSNAQWCINISSTSFHCGLIDI